MLLGVLLPLLLLGAVNLMCSAMSTSSYEQCSAMRPRHRSSSAFPSIPSRDPRATISDALKTNHKVHLTPRPRVCIRARLHVDAFAMVLTQLLDKTVVLPRCLLDRFHTVQHCGWQSRFAQPLTASSADSQGWQNWDAV